MRPSMRQWDHVRDPATGAVHVVRIWDFDLCVTACAPSLSLVRSWPVVADALTCEACERIERQVRG